MICPKCNFDGHEMHYCIKCGNGLNLPPTPEEKVFTATDMQKREAQFAAALNESEVKYKDLAAQFVPWMSDYAELKEELSKTVGELAKATAASDPATTPADSKLDPTATQVPMEPAPPSGVVLPR